METTEDRARREHMHTMWASVTDAWSAHASFVDGIASGMTERMLDLTEPRPGERVLELACGAGGVGLAAAPLVAPGGTVLLSDIAEGLVETAAARARALRLDNVAARVLDLEEIEEPSASFEVVVSRDGFQFALEPARAADEIHRVLRSGGRVALAVWGPKDANPWLGLVFDAVSEQLGVTLPPPDMPGPFSLGDAPELRRLLVDAGFADVTVVEQPVPRRFASVDEWWAMTTALAGPLAMMLQSLPPDVADGLRTAAQERALAFRSGDALAFPGLGLIAFGRREGARSG